MNPPRSYALGQRAISAEATRTAIIDATISTLTTRPVAEVTLERIASLAGCSTRTVIRHMGGRDRAIDLALEAVLSEAEGESLDSWACVDDGLRSIVNHYTLRGDLVWSILSQEGNEPRFAGLARIGRAMHRIEAHRLVELHDEKLTADDELIELVSVSTDVSTWQVLVRAHRKTPRKAGEAMERMTWALLTSADSRR